MTSAASMEDSEDVDDDNEDDNEDDVPTDMTGEQDEVVRAGYVEHGWGCQSTCHPHASCRRCCCCLCESAASNSYLVKSNPKGKYWKRRWCVLTPDELLYFQTRASVRLGEPPRGRVDLSAANLLTGPGSLKSPETPFVFRLVSGRRTYYFCAKDATKLADWCGALLVATQGGMYNSDALAGR